MKHYAMMPLDKNIIDKEEAISRGWKKVKCPKCGRECWQTNAYQNAKASGLIKFSGLCTECALKHAVKGGSDS